MTTRAPDGTVLKSSVGAVTVLTLNRPRSLNAIDQAMASELQSALVEIARDERCRCLVITGAGRAFCVGQALPRSAEDDQLPEDIEGLIRDRYVPIVTGLRDLMIPVVAAVNGVATGAGFSLALAADLRVASEEAWFSCGFAEIGLVPDSGATYYLPRYLGLPRALHLTLSGERIAADAAQRLGLVIDVYPKDSFDEDYLRFARELASGPTAAFGRAKQALHASLESSLNEQLDLEAVLQQASSKTEDFREGVQAFKERRPARFVGR